MVDTFGLQRDNIFDKRFKLLDQKLLLAPSNAATQQNIKLVALDDRTGIITLRHRVDREQLCKQTRVCMIKIQVRLQSLLYCRTQIFCAAIFEL